MEEEGKYLFYCSNHKSILANYGNHVSLAFKLKAAYKLSAVCRTSDLCLSAWLCGSVSSSHARVKPRWSDVINMASVFGSHKGHGAGVLFHQGLGAWMCSPRLSSGLYEGREGSLFPPCLKYFFLPCNRTRWCWNNGGHKEWRGNSGGLLLVPDVLARQHGGEGLVTEVCSDPLSSSLRCEASNHICFHSKQSGAGTAGSLSLLLKAFWGLLRDSPDGVIYPLFAEWTRIECDVYGHGILISHLCQDTYPEGLMNLGCLLQQYETLPRILH